MKILGLDLGTNSIGWAVVEKDEGRILDVGVRIFPEGVVKETIGTGDKEQSKNATRRDKRQMRRHFYRKRLRKIKLLEILISLQMCPLNLEELMKWKNWDKARKTDGIKFPDTDEFREWLKMNPYFLREKALHEEITLQEFGRVLYHMIQRRGFLSSRKSKEDSTIFTKGKPDENILPINETKEKIGDKTLGSYLYSISRKTGVPYRKLTDETDKEIRLRGRYTTREMYIAEFDKIWRRQAVHLELDNRMIEIKKTREIRGTLEGNRNRTKINALIKKYGADNIAIEKTDNKNVTKITSKQIKPLKEALGGIIEVKTDENGRDTIDFSSHESILFWQRPLRSQKKLIANCRFEDELPVIDSKGRFVTNKNGGIQHRSKKPCPLSHPEFELFRAHQFINNIRFGRNIKLTDNQRQAVLELINRNDSNFDFKKIPDALNLTYEKFNFEDKQKVPGNTTIKQLRALFEDTIWEEHYDTIWHCFYFYDDNVKLFKKMKRDFGFNGDMEAIKKVKLKDGYSNVSLKAIRNILPFLEKGYHYDKAVILGGVRNAFGNKWDDLIGLHEEIIEDVISILKEDNEEGVAIEKIKDYLSSPLFGFGFSKNDPRFTRLYHHSQSIEQNKLLEDSIPELENLRNPIVQQALYEMRRLVNTLLVKYRKQFGNKFHFDRINVEMGRELRNNKTQRQELSWRISENEKKNDEARARLAEFGLQPSRENIHKYLMFREIEERVSGPVQCPYTGRIIKISDLFGRDNSIQIEHIIPYSTSLDDSFGNKTLCEANFNREKGEKTPFEYYSANPDPKLWGINSYSKAEDGWNEIADRAFRLLPYNKAKKFTSKKTFQKADFIERQLNDTRYISRKAVELLSHICYDVRVMPGQLTAELRHLWGLNNIIQPVRNLEVKDFNFNEDYAVPCYLLTDDNGEIVSIHPKLNDMPPVGNEEILIPFSVDNKKPYSKYYTFSIEVPLLEDGKYWARLRVTEPIRLIPQFIDRPALNERVIVLKGRIEKGVFIHDNIGRIKTSLEDGRYWAKFRVTDKKFEQPSSDKPPKSSRSQILLFGTVEANVFMSYIYECKANVPDGKYWIFLDCNLDDIEFIRAENERPELNDQQIYITGTVDDDGFFSSEATPFQRKIQEKPGKYYAILSVSSENPEIFRIENEPPKAEKGLSLVEGNIWVDKYTGEIKFDPKKNREDHRHHAIDAIAIALTEQGYLQRLSTYNAQLKDKQRGKLDSTEKYPEPWVGFDSDVKKAIDGILVSHKKSNKTLTKNRKGFSVRGQLHKESIFGKHHDLNENEGYHIRVKITELETNKHVEKIVDIAIKERIKHFLQDEYGIDIQDPKGYKIPKDAFITDGEWRLFLPNKRGEPVPIKKVRIKENLGKAAQLKSDLNQWVNPRNNHHVLIYKDYDGNLKEDVVQFWTVVERILQGGSIYQLPEDGKEIITTLEINEMFLLGLSDSDYESNKYNFSFLRKNLYRVQKISDGDYSFRLHTASAINNPEEEVRIKSMKAWLVFNPIKLKINVLGDY